MDKRFDGFSINIFLDEDNHYFAHFIELPEVSAFGETPENALAELVTAWNLVKATYKDEKRVVPIAPSMKYYSGKFNVRTSQELHRRLAVEAKQQGLSLNSLINHKLLLG